MFLLICIHRPRLYQWATFLNKTQKHKHLHLKEITITCWVVKQPFLSKQKYFLVIQINLKNWWGTSTITIFKSIYTFYGHLWFANWWTTSQQLDCIHVQAYIRTYPVPSDCEIPWTIPRAAQQQGRAAKQRDRAAKRRGSSSDWVGEWNGWNGLTMAVSEMGEMGWQWLSQS